MNTSELHLDPLDTQLRQLLQGGDELADAGFSLRVMAALPPRVSAARRRRARWLRRAHWLAMSLAGSGAAALLAGAGAPQDPAHVIGGLVLIGLLILWTLPSRWLRP
jgi:hypothetical protein